MSLTIVMYHYVRDYENTRYSNIKGLDINEFKFQINYLNENYKILNPQEVKRKIFDNLNNRTIF